MSKKPYFIAEVSSNHNQDLNRALRFVSIAADIGFDAIKFQLFTTEDLFDRSILSRSKAHRSRSRYELPPEFIPKIAHQCEKVGLDFGVTPFSLEDISFLDRYVDFFKVASYELLWRDLLGAVARTSKPLVVSTGMATMPEVTGAIATLQDYSASNITLLHCVSAYPTPGADANLAAIETLRQHKKIPVGWSDHSRNPGVIYRAVHRWSAAMVEVHLDLDGEGREYAPGHCWLPSEIGEVIASVGAGLDADGSGEKAPVERERADRDWRADPSDGLRPMRHMRAKFVGDE